MLNIQVLLKTFVKILAGIPVTLEITFVSLFFGLIFGFLIAIARVNKVRGISQISKLYVLFMRGSPLPLILLLFNILIPSFLNSFFKKIGAEINVFENNPIHYAFFIFSLCTIATFSEIFRSALLTVSHGQKEAALTIGLTEFQAYRRIILPQTFAAALPNISTSTVGLIKNSSLAFILTIKDITALGSIEAAYGYTYIESYIAVFLVYIIVCLIVQRIFSLLEKRISKYRKKGGQNV